MKKAYETPMIDKIAFRYRDQVVAASGDPSALSDNSPSMGEQIISQILEGLGQSWCSGYQCQYAADYIA